MNYIYFENDGEINKNYITLLGVSTKEDDSTKIGFWGSGLKYALATLLRNNVSVKIFTGEKEVKITKTKVKIESQTVDVISVDGQKTSITTRAGKDWELWFAIREIHSNQIDCGNNKIELSNKPEGKKGTTRIYLELTDDINEITRNYDKYFSFKREKLFSNKHGSIMAKTGSMYRRGIRANSRENYNTIWDYDMLNIEINESRVFCYSFQVEERVASLCSGVTSPTMIYELFKSHTTMEHEADFCHVSSFSPEIVTYLKNFTIVRPGLSGYAVEEGVKNMLIVGEKMEKALFNLHKNELNFYGVKSSSGAKRTIPTSPEMLGKLKYAVNVLKLPSEIEDIVSFADIGGDVLGEYDKVVNKIYIDVSVLESPKLLQNTLLEEVLHMESGQPDCTRKFQNHIINRLRLALTQEHYGNL